MSDTPNDAVSLLDESAPEVTPIKTGRGRPLTGAERQAKYKKSPKGKAQATKYRETHQTTSKYKTDHNKRQAKYRTTPKGRAQDAKHKTDHNKCQAKYSTAHHMALHARHPLKKMLIALGLPKNYDVRQLVSDPEIADAKLEKIAGRNGYPDFRQEALEEKGPKTDFLSSRQWARAILEYRSGRKYRVAWRFTSTERNLFEDVFSFYEWQQSGYGTRKS